MAFTTLTADCFTKEQAWPIARAMLEAIEPGAGRHCLWQEVRPVEMEWRHHRLGVAIIVTVQGTPCLECGETALRCGREFRATGAWCCSSCRANGARTNHTVPLA